MKVFIDCEYNGKGGALLSIALIDMDGHYIYREIKHAYFVEFITEWVLDNVSPHLDNDYNNPDIHTTWGETSSDIEHYLSAYENVELIADWPEDVKYFCELMITGPGKRISTPPLTIEIRRDLDAEGEIPHHALSDVKAIRERFIEIERGE